MRVYDLRSDTVTKPGPEMRAAMASAEVGDDVFGEDPTVNELQETVARLFGHEDSLFVPSGTMGNQIAIKTHTSPGNEIICEADAHIFKYEAGAAGMISGVITKLLHGEHGILTASQIEEAVNSTDIHSAPTGLIALENTHNRAGGTIHPLASIAEISAVARSKSIPLHLDGARVFNACIAAGIKPMEYGKYFDSLSVCFSKGLGAPVGSALIGKRDFIQKARYYRKAFGGGMRQAGILAAGALYALRNNFDKLREDHDKAQKLGDVIRQFTDFEIDSIQTNIVIFKIVSKKWSAPEFVEILKERRILAIPFSSTKVRLVTHLDLSNSDISDVINQFKSIFN